MARPRATSRDPEDFARATTEARRVREQVAREVADRIADQVYELIVAGDIMGGRGLLARRLEAVVRAERREDEAALRAACVDGAAAFGAWAASIDFVPPSSLSPAEV